MGLYLFIFVDLTCFLSSLTDRAPWSIEKATLCSSGRRCSLPFSGQAPPTRVSAWCLRGLRVGLSFFCFLPFCSCSGHFSMTPDCLLKLGLVWGVRPACDSAPFLKSGVAKAQRHEDTCPGSLHYPGQSPSWPCCPSSTKLTPRSSALALLLTRGPHTGSLEILISVTSYSPENLVGHLFPPPSLWTGRPVCHLLGKES